MESYCRLSMDQSIPCIIATSLTYLTRDALHGEGGGLGSGGGTVAVNLAPGVLKPARYRPVTEADSIEVEHVKAKCAEASAAQAVNKGAKPRSVGSTFWVVE